MDLDRLWYFSRMVFDLCTINNKLLCNKTGHIQYGLFYFMKCL